MIIHYKNDLDSSVLFSMKVWNMKWFSILNMCLNMPLVSLVGHLLITGTNLLLSLESIDLALPSEVVKNKIIEFLNDRSSRNRKLWTAHLGSNYRINIINSCVIQQTCLRIHFVKGTVGGLPLCVACIWFKNLSVSSALISFVSFSCSDVICNANLL